MVSKYSGCHHPHHHTKGLYPMTDIRQLLEDISDKLMERGLLTASIEDGSLGTVSLRISGDQSDWTLHIDLTIDDRVSDELSLDEDEDICDIVDLYLLEKGLDQDLERLGYSLDNRNMIMAVLEA